MIDFEPAYCLFGHQTKSIKLFDRPDWWFQLPGAFAWHQCPECQLMFLNPRPTPQQIHLYYPDNYAAYRPAIDDEKWPWMRWKRRYNLLPHIQTVADHLKPPGNLLDVGSATGNYLTEMKKLGWDPFGVELNKKAAAYAQSRFQIPVFQGDLLANQFNSHFFSAITMWDLLEHTHNPLAILQEAHRLLKPNGRLFFSIPDPHSHSAQTFGPYWIGYDAPRHLYLFPEPSLSILLARAGFELIETRYNLATYHTWVASWLAKLNATSSPSQWKTIKRKIAYLPIWSTLTSPYFSYLNRQQKGTVLTVIAAPINHERNC